MAPRPRLTCALLAAGGGGNPLLTRLLGVVARKKKRRPKARQKSIRNYYGQFFAQANIEVIRGHQGSKDKNGFSVIAFELRKLET